MVAARPLQWGVMTFEADDWQTLIARWRRLEAVGLDSLWVGDHLWSAMGSDGVVQRPRFDAWVMLTMLAAATREVRIGTLVTSTAYRTPAVIAKQAISVDHLSGGRLELGIGAGANPRDTAASGLPETGPRDRASRFAEAVAVVADLLRRDRVTHHGSAFRFDDVFTAPRPLQRPGPPLLIAAHGDAGLRVAAEYGDGWVSYAGRNSPGRSGGLVTSAEGMALTGKRIARLEEVALEMGREPAALRRILLAGFTDDPWSESVQACVDFVSGYRELGVDEVVFPFPSAGMGEESYIRLLQDAMAETRP